MKTTTDIVSPAIAICAFACLVLSPGAHAVTPAPDGGYPGGNTAEGQNALFSLTSGGYNTAVGFYSLRNNTTANFNTAIGAGTLFVNAASENTASGAGALLSNTTGGANTANGAFALVDNTTGNDNTATGAAALFSNTTGLNNTADGVSALASNTDGNNNTAIGDEALLRNAGGSFNTAIGTFALHNSDGGSNTGVGYLALDGNTIGSGNTAVGDSALLNDSQGNGNTAIGEYAGQNVDGDHNICIGLEVFGNAGENNAIHIGDSSNPDVAAMSCFIGGIYGATSAGGTVVYVDSSGQLGTVTSSARFKDNIKQMGKTSEALFALQPVSFRYKKEIDPKGRSQFGLVAEDVEKVNPELVVRDKEGKPYSVRYDQVNTMLLNEFLKEHRKVQELEQGMIALTAQLKKQAAQIQGVSSKLELQNQVAREIAVNQSQGE